MPPCNCTLPSSPLTGHICRALPSSELVSVCLPGEAPCAYPADLLAAKTARHLPHAVWHVPSASACVRNPGPLGACRSSASCCMIFNVLHTAPMGRLPQVCPVLLTVLALPAARNFALIESQEVTFLPGLNVITGESGAGKSILIEALNQVRPALPLMIGA